MEVQKLTLKNDSNVTQIVFGGKPTVWIAKKDEVFSYNWIVAKTPHYTVVQSGLNNYIFETCHCEFGENAQLV